MDHPRRRSLAAVAALLAAPLARAQATYPSAVIRFVIPTAIGGGHDTMMRVMGEKITASWGQPTIVDSKPGGSGAIAAATVSKAPADGHTVMLAYSAFISNQVLGPNPGYKTEDFVPVCMMALTPIAIGARTSLGVNTIGEYVAMAKAQPRKITYGSYGPGSGGHFVGELLNQAAGIETVHVPYKGEAPAIQDLLGGQIDSAITSLGGVSRHPGRIRPLAVASPNRFPLYPDVPTFIEAGLPAVDMPGWAGAFVPAGTPKPVVEKLAAELNRVVKLPDVAPKLLELGFEPAGWGQDRLVEFMKQQQATIGKLVSEGRVKL